MGLRKTSVSPGVFGDVPVRDEQLPDDELGDGIAHSPGGVRGTERDLIGPGPDHRGVNRFADGLGIDIAEDARPDPVGDDVGDGFGVAIVVCP